MLFLSTGGEFFTKKIKVEKRGGYYIVLPEMDGAKSKTDFTGTPCFWKVLIFGRKHFAKVYIKTKYVWHISKLFWT